MKKSFYIFWVISVALTAFPVKAATIQAGDLIKASQAAVYYYGADGKRYVFPNEKTYKTWYSDFSSVKTITDVELEAISIGGNVTYRPGVKMVKIQTDPTVYVVAGGGTLRWVKTEELAKSLYGTNWSEKVEDIPDAFFTNYKTGDDITLVGEFIPVNETAKYASIDIDKGMKAVSGGAVEKKYVWDKASVNADQYTHKSLNFINYDGGFLAAWNDDRHGQPEVLYQKTDANAAGTGDVVRVSSNITNSENAKAYSDGNYLYIFWDDSSVIRRAIYLQKRNLLGDKLSQSVFASTTYATSKYPDTDYSSTLGEYGVAWWDSRFALNTTKGDVYFARMKDGLKIGETLRVSQNSLGEIYPQIVSAGDKFAVLWQEDDWKIKFALIDQNSVLSGSIKDIATPGKAVDPRMVWNGQNFGVVWADGNGGLNDVYFVLLDGNGAKVAAPKAIGSNVGGVSEPDILWTGKKFYASYTGVNSQDIYLAKVASNGNISEKDINISNTAEKSYSSQLAKAGEVIAVAWMEDGGTSNKILSARENLQ